MQSDVYLWGREYTSVPKLRYPFVNSFYRKKYNNLSIFTLDNIGTKPLTPQEVAKILPLIGDEKELLNKHIDSGAVFLAEVAPDMVKNHIRFGYYSANYSKLVPGMLRVASLMRPDIVMLLCGSFTEDFGNENYFRDQITKGLKLFGRKSGKVPWVDYVEDGYGGINLFLANHPDSTHRKVIIRQEIKENFENESELMTEVALKMLNISMYSANTATVVIDGKAELEDAYKNLRNAFGGIAKLAGSMPGYIHPEGSWPSDRMSKNPGIFLMGSTDYGQTDDAALRRAYPNVVCLRHKSEVDTTSFLYQENMNGLTMNMLRDELVDDGAAATIIPVRRKADIEEVRKYLLQKYELITEQSKVFEQDISII